MNLALRLCLIGSFLLAGAAFFIGSLQMKDDEWVPGIEIWISGFFFLAALLLAFGAASRR